jgi:hypothetical protein
LERTGRQKIFGENIRSKQSSLSRLEKYSPCGGVRKNRREMIRQRSSESRRGLDRMRTFCII